MTHLLRASAYQTEPSRLVSHSSHIPRFWHVISIALSIYLLGFASEGLASHTVLPSSLTYYAVQGATNPPKQTLTFTKAPTYKATLTASDNATWLTVSPTSQSETTRATITAAVNISGRTAGTYNATITVKEGTWFTKTVPVKLVISPTTTSPPSTTTKSATTTWTAVTSTPVSGYKVYVGEAPGQYSRTITVGAVTSATVNSLIVGKTYYFVVSAYNSAGEGPPSPYVIKTIQ